MESVYIPDTYSNVGACVFANIAELDIYTQVKGLGVLDYPAGWNSLLEQQQLFNWHGKQWKTCYE